MGEDSSDFQANPEEEKVISASNDDGTNSTLAPGETVGEDQLKSNDDKSSDDKTSASDDAGSASDDAGSASDDAGSASDDSAGAGMAKTISSSVIALLTVVGSYLY